METPRRSTSGTFQIRYLYALVYSKPRIACKKLSDGWRVPQPRACSYSARHMHRREQPIYSDSLRHPNKLGRAARAKLPAPNLQYSTVVELHATAPPATLRTVQLVAGLLNTTHYASATVLAILPAKRSPCLYGEDVGDCHARPPTSLSSCLTRVSLSLGIPKVDVNSGALRNPSSEPARQLSATAFGLDSDLCVSYLILLTRYRHFELD
jgi:hypothetical protein